MLFLDGVYSDSRHGTNPRFRRVKAPTGNELTQLTHTIARRVGRYLERQGLLECDTGNIYLTPEVISAVAVTSIHATYTQTDWLDVPAGTFFEKGCDHMFLDITGLTLKSARNCLLSIRICCSDKFRQLGGTGIFKDQFGFDMRDLLTCRDGGHGEISQVL